MMNPDAQDGLALPRVVIPLLKGVLYQESDPSLWGKLLSLESAVRDYVKVLNLVLVLDEAEGYAFLRSVEEEPESDGTLPRLYPRRPLSFPVSLMLALLRKKLAEFDATGGGGRLVLTREQVVEMYRVFLPEHANEARIADQIEAYLNRAVELGFVRKLKSPPGATAPAAYEVCRILKAFVDAQWLADFDARLETYRRHLETSES